MHRAAKAPSHCISITQTRNCYPVVTTPQQQEQNNICVQSIRMKKEKRKAFLIAANRVGGKSPLVSAYKGVTPRRYSIDSL